MALNNLRHVSLAVLLAGSMLTTVVGVNAQTLEIARVRLPTGQVVTIDDGRNWFRDERVTAYKRYYYEPREKVYVVYNTDEERNRHRGHGRNGNFCPPGQAKKGNC